MAKKQKTSKTTYIFLLVAVLVFFSGTIVYLKNKNSKTKLNITISKISDSAAYAQYCDNLIKFCFSYPKDWNKQVSKSNDINSAVIIDGNGQMNISYLQQPSNQPLPFVLDTTFPLSHQTPPKELSVDISNPTNFYVYDVTSFDKYSLVGGYVTAYTDNIPIFIIINKDKVSKLFLLKGSMSKISSADLGFDVPGKNEKKVLLAIGPITNQSLSSSEALSWLKSAYGYNSKQILSRVTF